MIGIGIANARTAVATGTMQLYCYHCYWDCYYNNDDCYIFIVIISYFLQDPVVLTEKMTAMTLELVQVSTLMQLKRSGKPIIECFPTSQKRL